MDVCLQKHTEAFYLCHPSPQPRAALNQEGSPQRDSPHGGKENRRTPAFAAEEPPVFTSAKLGDAHKESLWDWLQPVEVLIFNGDTVDGRSSPGELQDSSRSLQTQHEIQSHTHIPTLLCAQGQPGATRYLKSAATGVSWVNFQRWPEITTI